MVGLWLINSSKMCRFLWSFTLFLACCEKGSFTIVYLQEVVKLEVFAEAAEELGETEFRVGFVQTRYEHARVAGVGVHTTGSK